MTMSNNNYNVSVTIDNEEQILPILEIDKKSTYISLNNSLNTALNNDIKLNAEIFYIDQSEHLKIDFNGTVKIQIYQNEKIFYEDNVLFKQGEIKTNISNNLPLGQYEMKIIFLGNKYFDSSNLIINFNINKRTAICYLEKTTYYYAPLQTTKIYGQLKDKDYDTPINNYNLSYIFNNKIHSTTTNNNGFFVINVEIPEPDITHCNKNYKNYIIDIISDDSYHMSNTQIEIIVEKIPTDIIITSTNIDNENNIINVVGQVFTDTKTNEYVKYGLVDIKIPDFDYTYSDIGVINGSFECDINLFEIQQPYFYDNNEDVIEPYNAVKNINTSIILNGDIDTDINIGDMFTIEGKVQTTNNEIVSDGVIMFLLWDNDELVHRYVTELDQSGVGVFNFNTSIANEYQIQAQYLGIFNYQNTTSNKYTVRVIDV